MPVYRLTPLESTERDPLWQCSTMRPQCLWIRARDESDARRLVALATAVERAAAVAAPWTNASLVACDYDESRELAAGVIYVRRDPAARDSGRNVDRQ